MTTPSIALVAAQAENRVIGQTPGASPEHDTKHDVKHDVKHEKKASGLPWHVEDEQKMFRRITMGGVLIMGRKTFDTIGKPLPGRTTIIMTRNARYQAEGCLIATSLDDAVRQATDINDAPIYIVGGGEIYHQAMCMADCIHLTTIHIRVEGDVFFPVLPDGEFTLVEEKTFSSNIDYTYRRYDRKRPHRNQQPD